MLKLRLCDCKDAYILVKGTLSVTNTAAADTDENNINIKVILENWKLNNEQVDNAKDIDVVMPMYNLLEYGNNYLKTEGLSQYCRDEPALDNTGVMVYFTN